MNRKNEASREEVMNLFPGGVVLISKDAEEKILAVNDKVCTMYQCASKEEFLALTGGTYRGMMKADAYVPLAEMYARRAKDVEDDPKLYHFLVRSKEGHFRRLEVLLSPIEDPQYGPVWSLHIMPNRIREEALETDHITGLIGRYAFYKRALAVAAVDKEKGILGRHVPVYINLTNFKLYNANHGLEAGDELLRKLAKCLRKQFPETLMAHLSADNFAMLAERADLEEKLLALSDDFRAQNDDPSVALKAGITLYENLALKKTGQSASEL
ncbi:MAG: diguanylate cyclase domain-containing protein [Mitsuokella sp.]|uniref:diguanylate cyclase domain-containing protein n=1 Tax=Mitsuokella sp. TaxID=2049034 RepID=UPI003F103831